MRNVVIPQKYRELLMMDNRYNDIIDFCKSISNMTNSGSEGIKISESSLESGGFEISSLTYEELRAACVGLSYILLYRGMNMVIGKDQKVLWDRIGRILLDPPSMFFNETLKAPIANKYIPFRKLFVTTVKLATGELRLYQDQSISNWWWSQSPTGCPDFRALNPVIYLIYPLLEAVLKKTLSDYIDPDGTVKAEFAVSSGRKYKVGEFCSRVDHMIDLMRQQSEFYDLNYDLQQIYDKIETLYHERDPIKVISQEWRNPTIHGEDSIPTAYGILLNIVLLISMDNVKSEIRNTLTQ